MNKIKKDIKIIRDQLILLGSDLRRFKDSDQKPQQFINAVASLTNEELYSLKERLICLGELLKQE